MSGFATVALVVADSVTLIISEKLIYGVLGTVVLGLIGWFYSWAKPHVVTIFRATRRIRRAEAALDPAAPGIWLAPSIQREPPADYQRAMGKSVPIIVVANLKGGVGKTTTVANLIGHYGLRKGRNILALDMDFQGSLSAMTLSQAEYDNSLQQQIDGSPCKAAQLVDGRDGAWVRNVSVDVAHVPTARCIPSYYTLSSMENRVMVEWLIAKRTEDIRYSLARTLQEASIQDRFDMILIDGPPRLTTGCVQALCAATHVLIPTVLDGLSAEAAGGFVNQLVANQSLWPHLRLLGVFGNMTENLTVDQTGEAQDGRLKTFEADSLRALRDVIPLALETAKPPLRSTAGDYLLPIECFIPQKAELSREAGNRIAYQKEGGSQAVQDLSRAYDRLGDEIDRRISATRISNL